MKKVENISEILGLKIALARRAMGIKQSELAASSNIGMNTMVSIEKGLPTVQIGHYLAVLSALGLNSFDDVFKDIDCNRTYVNAMADKVPKRVLGTRKNNHRYLQ